MKTVRIAVVRWAPLLRWSAEEIGKDRWREKTG
jgi:hypothetical protein